MSASYLPNNPGMPQISYAPTDEQLAQWQQMQQQHQTTNAGTSDPLPGGVDPTTPPSSPPPPTTPPTSDPSSPLEPPATTPAPTPTGNAGTFANPFQQATLKPFRTQGMISDRTLYGANTAGVPFAGSGDVADASGMHPDNPDDEMKRQVAKEALMTQFFGQ